MSSNQANNDGGSYAAEEISGGSAVEYMTGFS
jgi:hypothetical protein